MDPRVSIFVCGVQKGGTTSLHAHFSEHPELLAPRRKEIHFFDAEHFDWAKPDYTWLDWIFPRDDGRRLRFDITPIYGFWPPSIARIRDYNPNARLIYLFRDPLQRAWSQWCMRFARREEHLSFAEAIREGRHRMDGLAAFALERRGHSYVERGFYGEQVRRLLAHFPRENILFLPVPGLMERSSRNIGAGRGFSLDRSVFRIPARSGNMSGRPAYGHLPRQRQIVGCSRTCCEMIYESSSH